MPEVESGEDIDFLVADEDAAIFLALLSRTSKSSIPVDVYTPSGIFDTGWNQLTYFPKRVSDAVLGSRVRNSSGISIPNSYWYAITLAYHAVYHKGYDSGLADSSLEEPVRGYADHDYRRELSDALKAIRANVGEVCLRDLEVFIRAEGCQPGLHVEEFLARRNLYVHESLTRRLQQRIPDLDSISVFFVRQSAQSWLAGVREILVSNGFQILTEVNLDESSATRVANLARGGNWGRGPFFRSGGRPCHVFVTLDVFPIAPEGQRSESDIFSVNSRVSDTKNRIREFVWKSVPYRYRFNPVHSTDNGLGAEEFITEFLGQEAWTKISEHAIIELRRVQQVIPSGAVSLSRHGRRAKIYGLGGKPGIVRKIFRPQFHDFLEREVRAREILGDSPLVDPLVSVGSNFIDIPLVRGSVTPIRATDQMIQELRAFIVLCAERKIQPLDFTPGNLLQDEGGRLRVVDLEFFQAVDKAYPPTYSGAVRSLPEGTTLVRPAPRRYQRTFYLHHWIRFVQLPRSAFVGGLPQFLRRASKVYALALIFLLDKGPVALRLLRRMVGLRNIFWGKIEVGLAVLRQNHKFFYRRVTGKEIKPRQ